MDEREHVNETPANNSSAHTYENFNRIRKRPEDRHPSPDISNVSKEDQSAISPNSSQDETDTQEYTVSKPSVNRQSPVEKKSPRQTEFKKGFTMQTDEHNIFTQKRLGWRHHPPEDVKLLSLRPLHIVEGSASQSDHRVENVNSEESSTDESNSPP